MGLQKDNLAFPFEGGDNNGMQPYSGMTIREYFAAKAMQAIIANNTYNPPRRSRFEGMAEDAVSAADALIAELNK